MNKYFDITLVCWKIISDSMAIFSSLMLAFWLRMHHYNLIGFQPPSTLMSFDEYGTKSVLLTMVLVGVLFFRGHYQLHKANKWFHETSYLFWNLSGGFALMLVIFYFFQFTFFSRLIFGLSWLLAIGFIFLGRVFLVGLQQKLLQAGIGRTKVAVVGMGDLAQQTVESLLRENRYELAGLVSEKRSTKKQLYAMPVIGSLSQIESLIEKFQIEEIWLASEKSDTKTTQKVIQTAHVKNIRCKYLPDELGVDLANVEVTTLGEHPVISILNTPMRGWALIFKTVADYVTIIVGGLIILPVMLVIALKIKLSDPKAPIFYASDRIGKNGRIFQCLKFRTMVPNAEELKKDLLKANEREGGVFFKLEKDPRVTPFGDFLRKTSLDEVPNLINVLKGEMSLVGPRPHLPEEVEQYGKEDKRLITIKPGVTGYTQINGLSNLSFQEEMKFELFYLKNWSLWLDLVIFVKTIFIVFKRKNVFAVKEKN